MYMCTLTKAACAHLFIFSLISLMEALSSWLATELLREATPERMVASALL